MRTYARKETAMSPAPRLVALAATLAFGLSTALAQPAEREPGAPSEVTFEVLVIEASATGNTIDPRLNKLSKRLDRTMFSSFKLLASKTVSVGLSSNETIPLPEGRKLVLKPAKFEKSGRLALFLKLHGKSGAKLVDLEATVKPGGDFMVGGPKMDDGTLLVYLRHVGQKP